MIFSGGRMEASKTSILDIINLMSTLNADTVEMDFEYDGTPLRFQCKLMLREDD